MKKRVSLDDNYESLHPLSFPMASTESGNVGDLTPRIFQSKRRREEATREKARHRSLTSRQRLAESSFVGKAHLLKSRPLEDPRTEPLPGETKHSSLVSADGGAGIIPRLKISSTNQEREPPNPDAPIDTSYIPKVPFNPNQARKTNDFIESLVAQKNYIDIFANPSSFMYLKRKSPDSAYDFVIVPHTKVTDTPAKDTPRGRSSWQDERTESKFGENGSPVYYTVSSKGITTNIDGDVEFMSLNAFEREYQVRVSVSIAATSNKSNRSIIINGNWEQQCYQLFERRLDSLSPYFFLILHLPPHLKINSL